MSASVDAVAIDVVVQDEAWRDALDDPEAAATAAARAALTAAAYDGGPAEIAIALSSDAVVAALNCEWRGREGPTNVLSFALQNDDDDAPAGPVAALGDVILARETTIAEATREDRRVDNHATHLVIHGVLHLLGYDHVVESEAIRMEGVESRAMAMLNRPDPYAEDGA